MITVTFNSGQLLGNIKLFNLSKRFIKGYHKAFYIFRYAPSWTNVSRKYLNIVTLALKWSLTYTIYWPYFNDNCTLQVYVVLTFIVIQSVFILCSPASWDGAQYVSTSMCTRFKHASGIVKFKLLSISLIKVKFSVWAPETSIDPY